MQRFVDTILAVTKESVKTVTYESLNNIVRLINGVSAILLAILPGKANILEGLHGWELRPTFRGPRFPRWMENGVSSFNKFVHELPVDSDTSSADYSSAEEDGDGMYPPTPSSQEPSPRRSQQNSRLDTIRKMHTLRDHVIHRTTDRRRGVIEDLHLAIEIFREVIFDFFHRAAYFILSPSEVLKATYRWFLPQTSCSGEIDCDVSDTSISMDNLGGDDPAPIERKNTFHQSLNTDARTCQDVITELGYPYEAIHVITSDGYVLLLERIPRRDSRKAVYLQHGILDSSMGWVPNGIVGSPAFAAYDQGYDVFLGNFRGLVSREHIDKNISSRKYWRYSNDHGTEDIPAMIEKIDQVKTAELKISQPDLEVESNDDQTYRLCAVSHSLGGAAMLMYIIIRRIEEKPHRLSRFFVVTCWLPL